MAMLDNIYAMAAAFAGELGQDKQQALQNLCKAAEAELCSRLLPGVDPAQCEQSFVCAAAWIALSNLAAGNRSDGISTFSAGEMSVSKSTGADTAANCLRTQAELIMAPYTGDHFSFMGVKG